LKELQDVNGDNIYILGELRVSLAAWRLNLR
jgi:hypothetical protein